MIIVFTTTVLTFLNHSNAGSTISALATPFNSTNQMLKLKHDPQDWSGIILMYLEGKTRPPTLCLKTNVSWTLSFLKPLKERNKLLGKPNFLRTFWLMPSNSGKAIKCITAAHIIANYPQQQRMIIKWCYCQVLDDINYICSLRPFFLLQRIKFSNLLPPSITI